MRIFYLLFLYKVVVVGVHKTVDAVPIRRLLNATNEHIDYEIPDDYIKNALAELDLILSRRSEQSSNNDIDSEIGYKHRDEDFKKKDLQIIEDNCEGNCVAGENLYKSIGRIGNNSEYGEDSEPSDGDENRTNKTNIETIDHKESEYSNKEESDENKKENLYETGTRNKRDYGLESDPINVSENEISESNIKMRNHPKNKLSNEESDESKNEKLRSRADENINIYEIRNLISENKQASGENGREHFQEKAAGSGSRNEERIIETGLKVRSQKETNDKGDVESYVTKNIATKLKGSIDQLENNPHKKSSSSSSNSYKRSHSSSGSKEKADHAEMNGEDGKSSINEGDSTSNRKGDNGEASDDNNERSDSSSNSNDKSKGDKSSKVNDEEYDSSSNSGEESVSDSENKSEEADKSSEDSDIGSDSSDYSENETEEADEPSEESDEGSDSSGNSEDFSDYSCADSTQEESYSASNSGEESEANSEEMSKETHKSSSKSDEGSDPSSDGSEIKSEEVDKSSKDSDGEESNSMSDSEEDDESSTDDGERIDLSTKCENKGSSFSDFGLGSNSSDDSDKERDSPRYRKGEGDLNNENLKASELGNDHIEKSKYKSKNTIPKGIGNYFVYVDCKTCKISSELEVKGKIVDKEKSGDKKSL